jgi:hypothetical protein
MSLKSDMNFTIPEFNELCEAVCPLIMLYARTTGEIRSAVGRQPKFSPQQRLLHFIIFMQHDNVVRFDVFGWNWSKSSACDDALFVASCINEALASELIWPNPEKRIDITMHPFPKKKQEMTASLMPLMAGCPAKPQWAIKQMRS